MPVGFQFVFGGRFGSSAGRVRQDSWNLEIEREYVPGDTTGPERARGRGFPL